MKWHFKIILPIVFSFFIGLFISIYAQDNNNNNQTNKPVVELEETSKEIIEDIIIDTQNNIETEENELTKKEIESLAKSVTVKVLSGDNSGSGILIQNKNNVYTVVTNHHVLIFGQENNSYQIITPDGHNYQAEKVQKIDFHDQDLGLLVFSSSQKYPVIKLQNSAVALLGNKVYAAGFPNNSENNNRQLIGEQFAFTEGNINMISELSFRGGYRIGYTNSIRKGMSGGPIFNSKGEIIGINGRHKYPLWGNPYVFEDGTIASPEEKEEMSKLSWGIPIQTFLKFSSELAQKSL